MKCALVNYRVHLLGSKLFVIYTDHASLPTATQSPHLSQRMARRFLFLAEYNFDVKYKTGKQNALADALSSRPDYEISHITTIMSPIPELIRSAYAKDGQCVALLQALASTESGFQLSARLHARFHRFSFIDNDLLLSCTDAADTLSIVVPHD